LETLLGKLTTQKELLELFPPDLSQTARFQICGFQFEYFPDFDVSPQLKITSQLADLNVASSDQLNLKGHVILENAHCLIESNDVLWNLKDQTFSIPGFYVITVNNEKQYGTGICLNSQLRNINPAPQKINKGTEICLKK
jgi:hypothetical protein